MKRTLAILAVWFFVVPFACWLAAVVSTNLVLMALQWTGGQ